MKVYAQIIIGIYAGTFLMIYAGEFQPSRDESRVSFVEIGVNTPSEDRQNDEKIHNEEDKKHAHEAQIQRTLRRHQMPSDIVSLSHYAKKYSRYANNYIEASEDLYKKFLQLLLNCYEEEAALCEETFRGRSRWLSHPVASLSSYQVHVDAPLLQSITQRAFTPHLHLYPHSIVPYILTFPLAIEHQQGYLRYHRPPHDSTEAFGILSYLLLDFLSGNKIRRLETQKNIGYVSNCILFLSWAGTSVAWMHSDRENGVSAGIRVGNIIANGVIHCTSRYILEYPFKIITAWQERRHQRWADDHITGKTLLARNMHPLIPYLARQYASNQIMQEIRRLESQRSILCWALCCPLFFYLQEVFKKTLQKVCVLERIRNLLSRSHETLMEKLAHGHGESASASAAQIIERSYRKTVLKLYELNPIYLEEILMRSSILYNLSYRKKQRLIALMNQTKNTLLSCIPHHLVEEASKISSSEHNKLRGNV